MLVYCNLKYPLKCAICLEQPLHTSMDTSMRNEEGNILEFREYITWFPRQMFPSYWKLEWVRVLLNALLETYEPLSGMDKYLHWTHFK